MNEPENGAVSAISGLGVSIAHTVRANGGTDKDVCEVFRAMATAYEKKVKDDKEARQND